MNAIETKFITGRFEEIPEKINSFLESLPYKTKIKRVSLIRTGSRNRLFEAMIIYEVV